MSAELCLNSGRSIGLLFREGLVVLLDHQEQAVVLTRLTELQRLDTRQVALVHGRQYSLRVVAKGEFFEAYLDDALILNFVRYNPPKGRFGLYIEAGDGTFSNVRAVDLSTTC